MKTSPTVVFPTQAGCCQPLTNTADRINIWQVALNPKAPPAAEGKTGSPHPYLIEEVFKHKVVVVVAGGQLHVLQTGKLGLALGRIGGTFKH